MLICTTATRIYTHLLKHEKKNGSSKAIDDLKFLCEKSMFKNKYEVNKLYSCKYILDPQDEFFVGKDDQNKIYNDGVDYAHQLREDAAKVIPDFDPPENYNHVVPNLSGDAQYTLANVYATMFHIAHEADIDGPIINFICLAYSQAESIEKKVKWYKEYAEGKEVSEDQRRQLRLKFIQNEELLNKIQKAGLEWMRKAVDDETKS